jgi:hypothetical protein
LDVGPGTPVAVTPVHTLVVAEKSPNAFSGLIRLVVVDRNPAQFEASWITFPVES